MEQKLSDTLVKAIDRSNPFMQNLQLASRFNKLIDEGGGGADLEDNKEATINVSAYTEPVEIEPTAGKDGMKKATVTLTNIPQPSGGATAYAWVAMEGANELVNYYNFEVAPTDQSDFNSKVTIFNDDNGQLVIEQSSGVYERISDTEFSVESSNLTRDPTKDFILWG